MIYCLKGLLIGYSSMGECSGIPGCPVNRAMQNYRLLYLIAFAFSLGSCASSAFYQSAVHNHTNSYKTIPHISDSISAAYYISGLLLDGGANYRFRDKYMGGIFSLYRAHNSGLFQAYYGITGGIGSYKVKGYGIDTSATIYRVNNNLDKTLITERSGRKFWGSIGGTGGINLVKSLGDKIEWRIIGTEFSWQREFGKYLNFRKNLPDTAANIIVKDRHYASLAFNTDFIILFPDGSVGFKTGPVYTLNRITQYNLQRLPSNYKAGYFSTTLHLTINQFTGFLQWNIGNYNIGSQAGINFRLRK